MKLTPDFNDWEISTSIEHPDLVIPFDDLAPRLVANAMRVLEGFAQPARDAVGGMGVLSFIRSPALTAAIPGAKVGGSHESGLAMDFRPLVITPAQFWAMAQRFDETLAHSGMLDAAGLYVFRHFDQRRDDVPLPPLAELFANEFPPLVKMLRLDQIGVDRLPAGRAAAQRRDVQIAKLCHAHRAGDRRGGHHKIVRLEARVFETRPLAHAEFVLLVDHDQAELRKRDVVLNDRLSADHQIDPARGDFLDSPAALLGAEPSDQ